MAFRLARITVADTPRVVDLLGRYAPPVQSVDPTLLPFAADSIWRLGIARDATFAAMGDQRNIDMHVTSPSPWANYWEYSHPIAQATNTDPLATVTDSFHAPGDWPHGGTWQERIPSAAYIAAGSDQHMHVITPDRAYLQEHFYTTRVSPTSYTTARRHQVDLTGSGIGPQNGTRAYGGSAVGGLIRVWEVDPTHPDYTGEIRHALAVSLRNEQLYSNRVTRPQQGYGGYDAQGYGLEMGYVWPATEQDSGSSSPGNYLGSIPMGSYFAIPPSVNINALGLTTPAALMVAKAAQDYGVYVTDRSGASVFYVEYAGESGPGANFTAQLLAPSFSGSQVRTLFGALRVVTSNGPTTPNGGPLGTRRRGA